MVCELAPLPVLRDDDGRFEDGLRGPSLNISSYPAAEEADRDYLLVYPAQGL